MRFALAYFQHKIGSPPRPPSFASRLKACSVGAVGCEIDFLCKWIATQHNVTQHNVTQLNTTLFDAVVCQFGSWGVRKFHNGNRKVTHTHTLCFPMQTERARTILLAVCYRLCRTPPTEPPRIRVPGKILRNVRDRETFLVDGFPFRSKVIRPLKEIRDFRINRSVRVFWFVRSASELLLDAKRDIRRVSFSNGYRTRAPPSSMAMVLTRGVAAAQETAALRWLEYST